MTLRITTTRLEIRAFKPGDLEGLHAMYGDSAVMEHIGNGRSVSREETARTLVEMIEDHDDARPGLLACEERATGRLVGRGGFKLWTVDGIDEMEIGWMVTREDQGRGIATEMGLALRNYAFDTLARDHVISVIQPANVSSIRVAEKVGERFWRDWVTPGGQAVLLYRADRPQA